jgi:uncharacterized membrane protein YfcA
MPADFNISPRDWIYIALGAIGTAFILFVGTHSVLACLLGGILGIGGAALALVLLRWICPAPYSTSTSTVTSTTYEIPVGLVIIILFGCFMLPQIRNAAFSMAVMVFLLLNVVYRLIEKRRREDPHRTESAGGDVRPDKRRLDARREWYALASGVAGLASATCFFRSFSKRNPQS